MVRDRWASPIPFAAEPSMVPLAATARPFSNQESATSVSTDM